MTINNSANKVIAAGNGVQTVFNFSFIAVNASDISVIVTDSSGNETTLAPALHSLSLNSKPPGQIWSNGGTVTYPLMGSPLPNGSTLTIVRTVPLTQLVALGNQGNVFPSAVETALDLITMMVQQVSELFRAKEYQRAQGLPSARAGSRMHRQAARPAAVTSSAPRSRSPPRAATPRAASSSPM
jgi:hypothetical protein